MSWIIIVIYLLKFFLYNDRSYRRYQMHCSSSQQIDHCNRYVCISVSKSSIIIGICLFMFQCDHFLNCRGGRAFLQCLRSRVPPFLGFAFAFPRSCIHFFLRVLRFSVPALPRSKFCFAFLFCAPQLKTISRS